MARAVRDEPLGLAASGTRDLSRPANVSAAMKILAAVALVVVVAGCGGDGEEATSTAEAPVRVRANDLLKRSPYMGVSCPTANAVACDRVGLHIALLEPATRVTAEIAGRPLALDDPEWSGRLRGGEGRAFAGFLQPAGLREPGPLQVVSPDPGKDHWIGRGPVHAPVTLRVERKDGSQETTRLERVWLAPGWG